MPSPTVENYLKQIYLLSREREDRPVPMGILAGRMAVVPGTATSMVKSMHREDWLEYVPRIGVTLTESGHTEALRVLRKHRILEMFLVEVLGLDWTEVHEEAELLEHGLTDKLVDRMDAFLGHPEVDPHGDPIPSADGRFRQRRTILLSEAEAGCGYRVAQVLQQDKEFLDYLNDSGLVPGAPISVSGRDPIADVVEIRLESGETRTMGGAAAMRIRVVAGN